MQTPETFHMGIVKKGPVWIDIRTGAPILLKEVLFLILHAMAMTGAVLIMPRGAGGTLHKIYHQ
jgi:hypothetical protein